MGGTTDYPEYFQNSEIPGYVIGSTIDKYVYVSIMEQPNSEKIRFRFSWRFTESVVDVDEITHPVLRTVLQKENWSTPLNISTMAALPGRSGLGSSSAFTVALLAAVNKVALREDIPPDELAKRAIQIERIDLQEAGGWQDQFHTAIGGLRCYRFGQNGVTYSDLLGTQSFRDSLSQSIVLIAMGGGRDSHIHAGKTSKNIAERTKETYLNDLSLLALRVSDSITKAETTEEGIGIMVDGMNEGWDLKKIVSSHESELVDEVLKFGLKNGARAGKLCGAGGTGFAAFIVDQDRRDDFLKVFDKKNVVPIRLIHTGNEVTQI